MSAPTIMGVALRGRKVLDFHVDGRPMPKGSPSIMRAKGGRRFVRESAACVGWQRLIADRAVLELRDRGLIPWKPLDAPIWVELAFRLPARKRERRELEHPGLEMDREREGAAVKPDIDKLARAVLDALEGVVYVEDSRIVSLSCFKIRAPRWSDAAGVHIRVGTL